MAESNNPIEMSGTSDNDSLDISELASLNEDYSVDFIEQLQNQLSQSTGVNVKKGPDINTDDAELFEDKPKRAAFNTDIEDNFIKKYKAKLAKEQNASSSIPQEQPIPTPTQPPEPVKEVETQIPVKEDKIDNPEPQVKETVKPEVKIQEEPKTPEIPVQQNNTQQAAPVQDIETVSGGNITERPLNESQAEYKNSLDYIDNNTKYSKYVIYIDPENKDFIDSLTVKERKNLINRIIKEQDSVVVTKKNLCKLQTIITHAIIAIITIAISIPCIYWVVNVSLENTINNYRTSQSMFQALYKEKGKIQSNRLK